MYYSPLNFSHKFCRVSAYNCVGFNIFRNDRTCTDNGTVADCYTGQYCGIRTYPNIFPENYRLREHCRSGFRIRVMVKSCNCYVMSYEAAVAQSNSSLVLESAAGIYKYVFPDSYIYSAFGVKRRKHSK